MSRQKKLEKARELLSDSFPGGTKQSGLFTRMSLGEYIGYTVGVVHLNNLGKHGVEVSDLLEAARELYK